MEGFSIKIITINNANGWAAFTAETIVNSALLKNIVSTETMHFVDEIEWKKEIMSSVIINDCFIIDQKERVCTLYCSEKF